MADHSLDADNARLVQEILDSANELPSLDSLAVFSGIHSEDESLLEAVDDVEAVRMQSSDCMRPGGGPSMQDGIVSFEQEGVEGYPSDALVEGSVDELLADLLNSTSASLLGLDLAIDDS